jgi:RimJ/RimL family protein N-acetyltransferase
VLWLYWSYIFPEQRNSGAAMVAMRQFIEQWDHDRFHKVATYTRPDNRVARLLMERYGYRHVVTHENHLFGEDYMLYEHPLSKAVDGYDSGVGVGFKARLRYALRRLLRL